MSSQNPVEGSMVMQRHRTLTLSRFENFIVHHLKKLLFPISNAPQTMVVLKNTGRITYEEAHRDMTLYKPCSIGDVFAPTWDTHWFRLSFKIPEEYQGRRMVLRWNSSSEAMVWDPRSPTTMPAQGLLGSDDSLHSCRLGEDCRFEYIVADKAKAGETITLDIEMACNGMFGNGEWGVGPTPPDEKKTFTLSTCEFSVMDVEAWDLLWDFRVISDIAKEMASTSQASGNALAAANRMVNSIHTDDRETWAVARAIAAEYFKNNSANGTSLHRVSAAGHCHLDTCWLWTYAETRRKAARSWATQLRLLERYPSYTFVASQAVQFEWLSNDYPELYAEIKEHVRKGRFAVLGGTWVEMDCNLPSGESLVRQFLYGQRFFKKEFGRYHTEFWLPDTFGYSSQLPQIMRGAGIEYFLTQKLSWNQFNKFPYSTFWWEGLNGSKVLAHFPPTDTYCSHATVSDLLKNEHQLKDKDRSNKSMLLFGHGDGGGGPKPEMLEMLSRVQDGVGGMPSISFEKPEQFFQKVKEEDGDQLLTWRGELYFEYHRGTYTTHAYSKRANRKSEIALQKVELLYSVSRILSLCGPNDNAAVKRQRTTKASSTEGTTIAVEYPRAELDAMWKLVLLNQFHDAIPGTSIAQCYVDSREHYEEVAAVTTKLISSGMDEVQNCILARDSLCTAETKGDDGKRKRSGDNALTDGDYVCCVFNPTGVSRDEVVLLPDGQTLGKVHVPPFGWSVAPASALQASAAQSVGVKVTRGDGRVTLENNHLSSTFDVASGHLISLVLKNDDTGGRECIEEGARANRLVIYDDNPIAWDAWDVDCFHLEKPLRYIDQAASFSVEQEEHGRARLKFTYKLSARSTLHQEVVLDASSRMLEWHNTAVWDEAHIFLKVEFPLSILSDTASFEVQFGTAKRPTHFNTSQDMARFESCAHRFVDLSEHGCGVALVNDCKYGHAVHGNIMRLSLLRAPKNPDASADIGNHAFSYAVLPHHGSGPHDGVVLAEAIKFNSPLTIAKVGDEFTPSMTGSFFSVDQKNIVLDTIKLSEDDDTSLVVRFYESCGGRGTITLRTSIPFSSYQEVDLLERPVGPVLSVEKEQGGASLQHTVKPWEIVTLMFSL